MENKIEIQLSKSKIKMLLIGSIAFVVFGLLFFLYPVEYQISLFKSIAVIRIGGFVSVVFFWIMFNIHC